MPTVQVVEADVTDEIQKGGPAFGQFVQSLGLAVAEAQAKLDDNLTKTAEKLSKTNIKTVAIYEQKLDDDGRMESGNPVTMELPLANYIAPTAYQWTRVHLQADMKVSEFNGANGANIQGKSSGFAVSARASYGIFGGFSAGGGTSYSQSAYEASAETSFGRDEAVGNMRMEATLEPRGDIRLPQPFVIQKGPRLKMVSGSRSDILNTASPPAVVGRKVTITCELRSAVNNAIPNKRLEFRLSDPNLNYLLTPTNGETDNEGVIRIEVRREGASFDPNQAPQPVIVRAWLGLVVQEIAINI